MKNEIIIGIIGDPSDKVKANYYAAVKACGVRTFPLIIGEDFEKLNELSGIIIPGGVDIDPRRYGKENAGSVGIDEKLDSFEWRILERAVELEMPVLGVCRGLQLVNVFFGGTLIQDMDQKNSHIKMGNRDRSHAVHTETGTFLYQVYHKTNLRVNSAHHQAIDVLGEKLRAIAFSDDQVLEAIEHVSLPIICVQWHPERMCLDNERPDTDDGLPIFQYFIDHYCKYSKRIK